MKNPPKIALQKEREERDPELERLARTLDGQDVDFADDFVDFFLKNDVNVVANRSSTGDQLRVRFYFPAFEDDYQDDAADWVESQQSDEVPVELDERDGFWTPRIVVYRQVGHDWGNDPVLSQVTNLLGSWRNWRPQPGRSTSTEFLHLDVDPLEIQPANAWLLFCSADGRPTPAELRDARRRNDAGEFDFRWTAAKNVEPGDLALIYSMHPVMAITHVARIVSRARLDDAFEGPGRKARGRKEQWAYLSAPIEIEPIELRDLRAAANDSLNLRGNAQFLRPEWIEKLTFISSDESLDDELLRLAQVPSGNPDLPDPKTSHLDQLRDLAVGAMFNEKQVERHFVEPLFRLAMSSAKLLPQHPIRRRRADYLVEIEGRPCGIVEVKLAIDEGRGNWSESPDFRQVRWYADELGLPAVLVDAQRILLIDRGASEPRAELLRRDLSEQGLASIRGHLLG